MPGRFYFSVESAGNIEPDGIIQEGIKELQRKLAGLIHGLGEQTDGVAGATAMAGYDEGPRSPDGVPAWQDNGFTTPYANGGAQSTWGGGGAATAYGTTPYGNSGGGGW